MNRHLDRTLELNKASLLALPNVIGVGIGYKTVAMRRTKEIALVVFVERKVSLLNLEGADIIPGKINNIPTDVVELGKIRFLNRTSKMRPVKPGTSIGHYQVSAGTFGALVRDVNTQEILVLSNNHVLANLTNGKDNRSREGDPILQPGSYDGGSSEDQFAVLERFVPLFREEEEPSCPIALRFCKMLNWMVKSIRPKYEIRVIKKEGKENIVDCALARPLKPELVDEEILGIGKVKGVSQATLGTEVKKSGRTSGLTNGRVIGVGVSLRVPLGPGEYCLFKDQVIADLKSRPGDSGSLILDKNNKAVGLLFAGSDNHTVFNKIHNVMRLLRIEFF